MIFPRLKKLFSSPSSESYTPKDLSCIYRAEGVSKAIDYRVSMTISAHKDTDYIPKVSNAGTIIKRDKEEFQVMHNGIEVLKGGYFGDWMEKIIRNLKGHHEPQEEKVFFEVLKRISGQQPTMIELGSYWAYYSMWFNRALKGAKNYCYEPDEEGLKLGIKNAEHNEIEIDFNRGAAGENTGDLVKIVSDTRHGKTFDVPIISVDDIILNKQLEHVDILHLDVQGAELAALRGAKASIESGTIRFIFISTHHQSISGDPLIHQKCLQLIKSLGGYIVNEHSVYESYSGDGLIVASFNKSDSEFTVDTLYNRSSMSLNRPPEGDLAILAEEYQTLSKAYNKMR